MDVAVESADALAGCRFDDEPVLVTDVVNGLLELLEVDPAVAEEKAVFLAVELTSTPSSLRKS